MFRLSDLVPKTPTAPDDAEIDDFGDPKFDDSKNDDDLPIAVRYWCYISATANLLIFLVSIISSDHGKIPLEGLFLINILYILIPLSLIFTWCRTIKYLNDNLFDMFPIEN